MKSSFFILFIFIGGGLWACSCFGPDTFLKSLTHLTVEVELIKEEELCYKGLYQSNEHIETFHFLKVLKVYSDVEGKLENVDPIEISDTLLFLEGDGVNCKNYLPNRIIGSRFILALQDDGARSWPSLPSFVEGKKQAVFYTSLCASPALVVKGNQVVGEINRNYLSRKAHLFHTYRMYSQVQMDKYYQSESDDFWKPWYFFWGQYWQRRASAIHARYVPYESKVQSWSRQKFEERLTAVISA